MNRIHAHAKRARVYFINSAIAAIKVILYATFKDCIKLNF